MTETEAKWVERVRQWRASGQSALEFAQGQEFEASTLRYWASRLNRQPAAGPVSSTAATPRESAAPIRMVRVRATRARTPPQGSASTISIAVGSARIEIQAGFDRALLSEVIEVLGGAR